VPSSTWLASGSRSGGIFETRSKQKKVSLAWVVRDAAEKYVADRVAEARRQGLE